MWSLGKLNETENSHEDGDQQNFKWPRSHCSVDSLGNVYAVAAKAGNMSGNLSKVEGSPENLLEAGSDISLEKGDLIGDNQTQEHVDSELSGSAKSVGNEADLNHTKN